MTAQDGRFSFENVKPGEYRLVALRSGGYVPGEFGQRSATGLGISFELSAGQQMRGVQLVLTPTGSISGRVYDRDGPVGKLQVQALRPIYRDGQRTLTIVQSVQTDDRGEYRLFWLPPGRYYVTAKPFNDGGAGRPAGPTRPSSSGVHISEPMRVGTFEQASSPVVTSRTLPSGEVIEETQVSVYYPGTTDVSAAARIDLRPGASADGLDIAVTTGAVRHAANPRRRPGQRSAGRRRRRHGDSAHGRSESADPKRTDQCRRLVRHRGCRAGIVFRVRTNEPGTDWRPGPPGRRRRHRQPRHPGHVRSSRGRPVRDRRPLPHRWRSGHGQPACDVAPGSGRHRHAATPVPHSALRRRRMAPSSCKAFRRAIFACPCEPFLPTRTSSPCEWAASTSSTAGFTSRAHRATRWRSSSGRTPAD